jgi:hypothetical protein
LLIGVVGVVEEAAEVECPLVNDHTNATPQYFIKAFLLGLSLDGLFELTRDLIPGNIPVLLSEYLEVGALSPPWSFEIESLIEGINKREIVVLL